MVLRIRDHNMERDFCADVHILNVSLIYLSLSASRDLLYR